MAVKLQVGNEIFEYSEQGDGNYGEDNTSWAESVTKALQTVQGPNDILLSTATLINNTTSSTNVTNLTFNTANVLSVSVDYFIVRVHNPGSGNVTLTESGTIDANFDGTLFKSLQSGVGDVGVGFTVNASGQVQYTSTDLTGHISSTMRYRAKTIDQP